MKMKIPQKKRRIEERMSSGKTRVRKIPTTGLRCHKCGKVLSGRASPTGKPSIVFKTINGKTVPLHYSCWHYYYQSDKKGSGYAAVKRLVGPRKRRPRRKSSRRG